MKYTLLPVYYEVQGNTEHSYFKCPLMGCDYIYNHMPDYGQDPVVLAEGSALGYQDLSTLAPAVISALTFNPFRPRDFLMNLQASENELITNVIKSFAGGYSVNGMNTTPCYYPNEIISANLVGYNDLYYDRWGQRASNGISQLSIFAPYLGLGSLLIPYNAHNDETGVSWKFVVSPESYVNKGYFDFSGFKKSTGNYVMCIVELYIYYKEETIGEETQTRYNWSITLTPYRLNDQETTAYDNYFQGKEFPNKVYDTEDPNGTTQPDGDEGGNGDTDPNNDPTPVPDLPSIDITSLGGIKLYRVSPTDLGALFSYLNSHDAGETILKWFTNPIQAILACYMLPYPVEVESGAEITVLGLSTGVGAYKAAQWTDYNMGSVFLAYGFDNTFLDYAPFCKLHIFLPFIGVRPLNIDECVGHTIGVRYQFDNTSGGCCAYVTIDGNVRYAFSGSCAVGIPLSQQNWGQFYMACASTVAGAMAGGISGAAGAIAEGQSLAGIGAAGVMGAVKMGGQLSNVNAKPTISRCGSLGGAAGALGINYPYLIVERPDKANVANPRPVIGVPSGRTLSLGSLSGYNIIEHVHLSGIAATASELEEIERLLYEGVVF